jgi:hypothetical protein
MQAGRWAIGARTHFEVNIDREQLLLVDPFPPSGADLHADRHVLVLCQRAASLTRKLLHLVAEQHAVPANQTNKQTNASATRAEPSHPLFR